MKKDAPNPPHALSQAMEVFCRACKQQPNFPDDAVLIGVVRESHPPGVRVHSTTENHLRQVHLLMAAASMSAELLVEENVRFAGVRDTINRAFEDALAQSREVLALPPSQGDA